MLKFKKIIASIFLILFLMSISVQSFAWGQKGHDIICSIAEANLKSKVKKKINKILDGHSIVYYSSWMDSMQNYKEWKEAYDSTKTWHYGNIDEGFTYETMKKCPTGDIYTATEHVIAVLKTELLDKHKESYYLKMLIHLIGDMHCPMHAGRLSDRGGNDFPVIWFKQANNLHSIWDTQMIESYKKWSYTEWSEQLGIHNKKQKDSITKGSIKDWFLNTTLIAKQLYTELKHNENLSYAYMIEHGQLLEDQLVNAGYRLAKILNEIYK